MREIWPSQNSAKFRKIRREICAQEHHGALAVVPQRDGVGGGREAELQRRQRAERRSTDVQLPLQLAGQRAQRGK